MTQRRVRELEARHADLDEHSVVSVPGAGGVRRWKLPTEKGNTAAILFLDHVFHSAGEWAIDHVEH